MEENRQLKNEWTSSAFDREKGEWVHTTNYSYEHQPKPADIDELLVRRAPSAEIRPLERRRAKRRVGKLALIGGDLQAPYGDPEAVRLFHRAVQELQPDTVGLVGDMVDFAALSTFSQRKEFVGTTQQGIDDLHEFVAGIRANAPNTRIVAVGGNHEQRLVRALERNMSEIAGIRRAKDTETLLSVQHLARFDELEVEYVDGYPNGTYWLEDNLKLVHGTNVKKGGSNAAKYLNEERETTIYGHTHRMEVAYRTFATRLGSTTISAASPGALCLSDGTVPGFRYSPTANGELVKHAEDWQKGALVVEHQGEFHDIRPVRFTERGMTLEGKHHE